MEVGETDLNNLLIEQSGKKISMSFIRHIWEHVRPPSLLSDPSLTV
jgi:serine/threonine-protein kinase TTK/MPS1